VYVKWDETDLHEAGEVNQEVDSKERVTSIGMNISIRNFQKAAG